MNNFDEVQAFPSALDADVRSVLSALSDNQMHQPHSGDQVRLRGEVLEIPSRVYYRESDVLSCISRSGLQGKIALCLGTRHCNGFLREKCVQRLVELEDLWIVPFVVQLVGEYVLPIVQVIERAIPRLNTAIYGEFLSDNPAHLETIARRVVSYWNVYYRNEYPKLHEYPASEVLDWLRRSTRLVT